MFIFKLLHIRDPLLLIIYFIHLDHNWMTITHMLIYSKLK